MRVEFRAIDLERGEPRLIARADLDAIVERLVGPVGEPETQALFDQLLMAEVTRQA